MVTVFAIVSLLIKVSKNRKIICKLKEKFQKVGFKLVRTWECEADVDESITIDKKFILSLINFAFDFEASIEKESHKVTNNLECYAKHFSIGFAIDDNISELQSFKNQDQKDPRNEFVDETHTTKNIVDNVNKKYSKSDDFEMLPIKHKKEWDN